MDKSVLLIIFLASLTFPQYGEDTIPVNISTLLRASQEGAKVINFDNGRSVKIIIDTSSDSDDVWGFGGEKAVQKKEEVFSASQPYGVTPDGDYFLAKSLAKKFGDSLPQVSCAPYWGRHKMTESGAFYVYRSGKKVTGNQAYRFFVYGRGLPGELLAISRKTPGDFKINWEEIANDEYGGSYFYSAPVEPK